jgi:hypothetical protein
MARLITRRRLFGLTVALTTLAVPHDAQASGRASEETFTLYRSGGATVIKDAGGATVYASAGSVTWGRGTAADLGALLAAVQDQPPEREGRG